MRPYFAVIADSFRAASSSRVLWVALIGVALLLIAIAPVGYRENAAGTFSPLEIVSSRRLTTTFQEALAKATNTPERRIALAFPESLQEEIRQANVNQEGQRGPRSEDYAEAFNALITDDQSWFDGEAWKSKTQLSELRGLNEQGDDLSDSLSERRARLRLEAALRGLLRPRGEKTISLTYAIWETPAEFPLSRELFIQSLTTIVVPMLINGLLGYIGIILGILVTSPIMPEMLQPGSLHLLLSKPISRSGLYLAKFFGGCAFMLLCVAPLLAGVWLILGLRFDVWLSGLFYCIPVYLLMFMVYYSVSCLAALRWRSAIVAALVSIAFWVFCGLLGFAGRTTEDVIVEISRLDSVTPIDHNEQTFLYSATRNGELMRWDDTDSAWSEVPLPGLEGNYLMGPTALQGGTAVVTKRVVQFGGLQGSNPLVGFDVDNPMRVRRGLQLPSATTTLLTIDGQQLIAAGPQGIQVADRRAVVEGPQDDVDLGGILGSFLQRFGAASESFQSVLPAGVVMQDPMEAVVAGDELVVYSAGLLMRLRPAGAGKPWELLGQVEVDGSATARTRLAASKDWVVLIRNEEPMRLFDRVSLEKRAERMVDEDREVVQIVGDVEGDRFAIRFSGQEVQWLMPDESLSLVELPAGLSGSDAESMRFDGKGNLWLAHSIDTVSVIDAGAETVTATYAPRLSTWRRVERYVLSPLLAITPQTGELREEVVRAALIGDTTVSFGSGVLEDRSRSELNIARPVSTCLGFTAVLLVIGCVVFVRQDH